MTSTCWQLRARPRGDVVVVDLELLVDGDIDGGPVLWHDALPIAIGRPRKALTCARLVSAASGGAISRSHVLRCIWHAEQHADWRRAA